MSETKKRQTKKLSRSEQKMVILLLCISLLFFATGFFLEHSHKQFEKDESLLTLFPFLHHTQNNTPQQNPNTTTATQSTLLIETDDAGWEYIDETLFLGDSNTARFLSYVSNDGRAFVSNENTIAVAGMGIEAVNSLACMEFSSGIYAMPYSVFLLQPRRIIMTFGTNDVGLYTFSIDQFIATYIAQIQSIVEAYPYSDIIVNSIPPVTAYTSYTNVNNYTIQQANAALLKMCEENNLHYLDSYSYLVSGDYGNPEYFDGDGLHFNQVGVSALFDYIRTHALITDDRRPQPLNAKPYVIGPKTNMLMIDPLTNQEFQPNVLNPYQEPTYIEPTPEIQYEEPIYEEPIYQEPTSEEPIQETPIEEYPQEEVPISEEPTTEMPIEDTPISEEPIVEDNTITP
ncbi:MAG: hypothetical protein IJ875_01970 [Solobacterium sp.]|nr:hypothetical protein [Solobacterium sp.]